MKICENGIYRELTPEEIAAREAAQAAYLASPEYKLQRIEQLKAELAASDYRAIKFAEGLLTMAEYAPIKEHRQSLRDEINKLEGELNNGISET
jgi:hypothetical protein